MKEKHENDQRSTGRYGRRRDRHASARPAQDLMSDNSGEGRNEVKGKGDRVKDLRFDGRMIILIDGS